MDIKYELRAQANQDPLDVDLIMFDVAATKIEELENALIRITDANPNWMVGMNLDKNTNDICHLIVCTKRN